MNKEAVIILLISSVFILPLAGLVGYTLRDSEMTNEYSSGYDKAREEINSSEKQLLSQIDSLDKDNQRLQGENKQLTDRYNDLAQQASSVLIQPQSLHCTSYDYGMNSSFTSTTCY